jgi:hypothetical protein
MPIFSDDFPFTKRRDETASQPGEAKRAVVQAQPLASDAFDDGFPFTKGRAEITSAAAEAKPASTPASSIFPPGFPFVEREPEAAFVVDAAPAMTQAAAATAIDSPGFAPSPGAPIPAPAPVAPLPFKDRRRSPRQRMNAKATLRLDNVGGNPLTVEIDNLSLLGVRLRADRELLINDKANIRLEVGPLKWASRLRVINCIRHADTSYTIGCEFVGNELARGRVAA